MKGFYFILGLVLFVLLLPLPGQSSLKPRAQDIHIVSSRWPNSSDIRQFSLDAIRLTGAETYEEKAVAIWRFIRMWTAYTTGKIPKESKLGNHYVDDPLKVLNVYGAHHCDGLARIMEAAWRSLGMRAEKLYRSGHTQADLFWEDADGVFRGHLFDVSEGWFVYDRTGRHIASPDDIAVDYSLIFRPSRTPIPARAHYWGMYNWIHAPHIAMPQYAGHFSLRENETFRFYWKNLSKPYLDNFKAKGKKDFEHGNYPVTYGNSVICWSPDRAITNGMVYTVSSPYIISGGRLQGRLSGDGWQPLVRCLVSVDSGTSWGTLWDNAKDRKNKGVDIDLSKGNGSPVGRYDYQFKWTVEPEGADNTVISDFHLKTIVQHNIFSLPQLFPGSNIVSVDGTLENGAVLELTWQWRNRTGRKAVHRTRINRLPQSYEIMVPGRRTDDITLEFIEAAVVDDEIGEHQKTGDDNRDDSVRDVLKKFQHAETFDTLQIIGRKYPAALKPVDVYIDNIKNNKNLVHSLAGIMVLRDAAAWEVLRETAFASIKHPVKEMAVQALFLIDPRRAVPVLFQILEKAPEVVWKHDPANPSVRLQHHYYMAALIGRIFAVNRITRGVPYLTAVLRDIIVHNDKAWQPHASIIKSLGMLGRRQAAPAIRPFLDRHPDTAAVAVWALGKLGDKASINKLRQMFDSASYELIQQNSAVALCRLEDTSRLDQILALLESPDENFRGLIANALGETKRPDVIQNLKQLIAKETFPWVRAVAQESIEQLGGS